MARIVIDTNVFVSALLSADGGARKVLRLALRGDIQPVFGNALFAEYESLLARGPIWAKCPLDEAERATLFEALLSISDWVRIHFLWRPNLSDEADNHVLELAVAAAAEAIVTANVRDFGSAELLFPRLSILTPADFLKGRQMP
jgi:putative PIN family toxin of toxin-antitoxin system